MTFKPKKILDKFLYNNKDYPILVGFISGFYPIVFLYSNNFESNLSFQHLCFFGLLFFIVPICFAYIGYQIISNSEKFKKYKQHFLFLVVTEVTCIFLSQVVYLTIKKKLLLITLVLLILLSIKLHNQYKKIILLIGFMCLLPIYKISKEILQNLSNSSNWQIQPDAILAVEFVKKPNVYYIQPDGYTNAANLKDSVYNFDNSDFDNWLQSKKFTLYDDFRSNYSTTLLSNTASFFMKHHLFKVNSNFNYERDFIVGKNPVLAIFKNNNYKTFFITERPYLLINRPKMAYDYCNFSYDEVPFFDGWRKFKNITNEFKNQVNINTETNNFFFIEKFSPGHIAGRQSGSKGKEKERIAYLESLKNANKWLKEIIAFIDKNDPNAIVIIAADHGGFVGFEDTSQSTKKITDEKLLHSIFGAKLAIKWNDPTHNEYDSNLKTPVNLFRVLFSNLSNNKLYLNNLQDNNSYNLISKIKAEYYLAIE